MSLDPRTASSLERNAVEDFCMRAGTSWIAQLGVDQPHGGILTVGNLSGHGNCFLHQAIQRCRRDYEKGAQGVPDNRYQLAAAAGKLTPCRLSTLRRAMSPS